MTELSVAREMQVTEQMRNLEGGLHELEAGMGNIKARLTPVLRDGVTNDDSEREKGAALVPLANDIRALAHRIQVLNTETVNLLRDLEL